MKWLQQGRTVAERLERLLLSLLLLALAGLALLQIMQRNLLGSGFVWSDELLRLLVLWLCLAGAMRASRHGSHIRMDLLARWLPPAGQRVVVRLVQAVTALVCLLLAWHGGRFVRLEAEFASQVLGGWPAWWFQSIVPLAFAVMAWRAVLLMLWPQRAETFEGSADALLLPADRTGEGAP